jgi:DNA polymerase III subunit alpha
MDELKEILAPSKGPCPVLLRYRSEKAEVEIVLGEEWRVSPAGAVLERLGRLAGERNVHLEYRAKAA